MIIIMIEDMATLSTLAKIYYPEYFCSTNVPGLGKIFVQQKFAAIGYSLCSWDHALCPMLSVLILALGTVILNFIIGAVVVETL